MTYRMEKIKENVFLVTFDNDEQMKFACDESSLEFNIAWYLDNKNLPKEIKESYAVKRQREYPPISEYIDGVVKGDEIQIQKYIDACKAVKNKYPKE
jgi:uncharacterized protein (UPF0297 family)